MTIPSNTASEAHYIHTLSTYQESVDIKELALVFKGVVEDFHVQAYKGCSSYTGDEPTFVTQTQKLCTLNITLMKSFRPDLCVECMKVTFQLHVYVRTYVCMYLSEVTM